MSEMRFAVLLIWLACTTPFDKTQFESDASTITDSAHDGVVDSGTEEDDTVEDSSGDDALFVGLMTDNIVSSSALPLNIMAWYPTQETNDDFYTYGWTGFSFSGGAQEEAAAFCDAPRPVIVHSHGNASVAWELYPLHEALAAQGYVVVAPDHSGNTFYANTALTATLTLQRPQDIRDAFDWLVAQSTDQNSRLFGCVDPNQGYVASGFSFGGYTAYVLAGARVNDAFGLPTIDLSDSRVSAAMVYAPWSAFMLDSGTREVNVPLFSVSSARDLTMLDEPEMLFSNVQSLPRAFGLFVEGGHFTFTPQYCPYLPANNGCGLDNIDPERAMDIIIESTSVFLKELSEEDQLGGLESDSDFSWQFWAE